MNTVAIHSLKCYALYLLSLVLFATITTTSSTASFSSTQQDDSFCNNSTSAITTVTTADIVIVGAGISGLSTYVELKRLDPTLNIVIVEATDRIGGRVKKGMIGNSTIELGANWFHNIATPLYMFAKKMNLRTSQTTYLDIDMYNKNGWRIRRQFHSRLKNHYLRRWNPWYQMIVAANETWEEGLFADADYDGSESVLSVLQDLGYDLTDTDELDQFILWWLIDYELGFQDVALINFNSIDYDIPTRYESETFVTDRRGMESIIQQYVIENIIEPIYFNTRVTDIIYNQSLSNELNETYMALIQTVNTTNTTCPSISYLTKRVVVTLPASILHGAGYTITFQPSLNVTNLPFYGNQYNKVFFHFKNNFWGTRKEFIAILRTEQDRYLCNHWTNVDVHIPGSNILFCLLTSSGMEKFITRNLTTDALLDPLRVVYGTDVVNENYQDVLMVRWDLEPSSGYTGYASFRSGYTLEQMYQFYGGYDAYNNFFHGEGYNNRSTNEWIVHFTGAASCYEYYETIDGAYFSGIRTARYVLRSFIDSTKYKDVEPFYECEP